jgi:hypothetical protein
MYKKIPIVSGCIVLISLACLFLAFNPGCTDTEPEVVTEYVDVIFLCWLYESYQTAALCSDPVADPNQSQVEIAWDGNSVVWPYEEVIVNHVAFSADLYLETATNYTVSLTSNVGDCAGTVAIPEEVVITNPNYGSTLPLGQDVNCTWTDAAGADFYWVSYYADGYDSNGYYVGYFENDTFITHATLTIPSILFNIPNAVMYEVSLTVEPGGGPPPEPGSTGNMTGSISGFLCTRGDGDYIYFYVGSLQLGIVTNGQRKPSSVKDRMNSYLKQLGVETIIE